MGYKVQKRLDVKLTIMVNIELFKSFKCFWKKGTRLIAFCFKKIHVFDSSLNSLKIQ